MVFNLLVCVHEREGHTFSKAKLPPFIKGWGEEEWRNHEHECASQAMK
jgi:hypothetical protein